MGLTSFADHRACLLPFLLVDLKNACLGEKVAQERCELARFQYELSTSGA
jgi:hypothetical protein